ncbi:MAG: hypothetical protein IJD16_07290 [Desulfovibrio sp.]|nr:hypothetical protein [Desulfovibrio sp.]
MRIPLVLQRLDDLLSEAEHSREKALASLGTVEFLLDFLHRAATVNSISNMHGVREYIRTVRTAMHYAAGLINESDTTSHLFDSARAALSILRRSTLLGEKPELLEKKLTHEGNLLSD